MPERRQINAAGLDLLKRSEGCHLSPYKDSVGKLTIGYGHLIAGHEVFPPTISEDDAENLLRKDLAWAEDAVSRLAKVPLSDNQFAALVSLTFNVGAGALEHSTLLQLFNAGHTGRAADQFLQWDHAGGKVVAGLLTRRKAERSLFLTPDTVAVPPVPITDNGPFAVRGDIVLGG